MKEERAEALMSEPLRVLIVEDSEDDVALVVRELRRGGWDVTWERVETAEAMAAALDRGGWDLILSDFTMPRFSAPAALALYQERGVEQPFIIVSGTVGEETAVAAMKAGAHDFLTKQNLARLGPAVARELREAGRRKEGRRAEEQAAAVLRTAMDGFCLTDAEGRILEVNDAYCRLSGYGRDELPGMRVLDVEVLETPEDFARHMRRVMETGADRFETRHRRKDGTIVDVEVSVTYLRGSGRFFAFLSDITERKRAEQALRAAEERYRTLFERNLAGVYRSKCDGRIMECNEAFAGIYGYPSREEILGHRAVDLYPDAEARAVFIDRLQRERTLLSFESQGRRKDGSPVWILENVSLADCEDGDSCAEGTVIDITERKRLEEQLVQAQKMEAVGQLAGGVAHDFNNLLGVITGYSELALKDLGLQHPAQRRVVEIRKASERAAALTRQLLAFSRKQVFQPKVLDLNAVVADIEKMLRRLIGEDIHLVTAFTEDLGRVTADPGQIEQVIVNLAVNARDAMSGGGRLIIETGNADLDEAYARSHAEVSAGPHVMLAVTDTGCGMDAATASRIFEPFFTTKQPGKGTGLGLATVYGIVKQSGGHINVDSEVGRGSTFKVYLPRVEAPQDGETAAGLRSEPPRGTESVLLVEDQDDLREVIQELLEEQGYTVLAIAGGDAALDLVRQHGGPIDLLLTDMVMPGMNGRELAGRVAVLRPQIRVLYMSGYSNGTISERGILVQGVHLLEKPCTSDALARAVRQALDGEPSGLP